MGAGIELFMIKTGFCKLCNNATLSIRCKPDLTLGAADDIVTRREAENRLKDRLRQSEEEAQPLAEAQPK